MSEPIFASSEMPLRSSLMRYFLQCPHQLELMISEKRDLSDIEYIQIGTAVHKLIELHTTNKKTPSEIVINKTLDEYKVKSEQGRTEAIEYFRGYIRRGIDELQSKFGTIIGTEREFFVRIPHHKEDQTKKEIVIGCTIDQIRRKEIDGYVIDFKVSKLDYHSLINTYAIQLLLYRQAMKEHMPELKWNAVISNPMNMAKPRASIASTLRINEDKANRLLYELIPYNVMMQRHSKLRIPGSHCAKCPGKGFEFC